MEEKKRKEKKNRRKKKNREEKKRERKKIDCILQTFYHKNMFKNILNFKINLL